MNRLATILNFVGWILGIVEL